jgi:beta-lactamase regulating signal transducer with metallopeptidase domain
LGLVAAFFILRAVSLSNEVWRARRWASGLLARACADAALGVRILPTEQPLCALLGVVRPSIVLSRGLMSSVDPGELRAILEHERAHADRRDTLWALMARLCSVSMLPSRRRELLAELALAAEQSSDERAASVVGDRLAMAEVILKVERLVQDAPARFGVLAASFSGIGVIERVTALLEPPRERRRRWLAPLLLTSAVVVLLLEGASFHHLLETLIGALTG